MKNGANNIGSIWPQFNNKKRKPLLILKNKSSVLWICRGLICTIFRTWATRKFTVFSELGWLLVSTFQTNCNCKFTWQMASMPGGIFQPNKCLMRTLYPVLVKPKPIFLFPAASSFVGTVYNGLFYSYILVCNFVLFLCYPWFCLSRLLLISHPLSLSASSPTLIIWLL